MLSYYDYTAMNDGAVPTVENDLTNQLWQADHKLYQKPTSLSKHRHAFGEALGK